MSTTPQVREQLQSLRIPKEQRPRSAAVAPTAYVGRRSRRRVWPFMLVLVAAAGGTWGYLHRDKLAEMMASASASMAGAQTPVHVIKVAARRHNMPAATLTATGKIVSDHRVQVSTKVSGQI